MRKNLPYFDHEELLVYLHLCLFHCGGVVWKECILFSHRTGSGTALIQQSGQHAQGALPAQHALGLGGGYEGRLSIR